MLLALYFVNSIFISLSVAKVFAEQTNRFGGGGDDGYQQFVFHNPLATDGRMLPVDEDNFDGCFADDGSLMFESTQG